MGSDSAPDEQPSGGPPGDSGGGPSETAGDGEPDPFAFESYYDLLGVPETATRAEIERAYRELAKRHHPDASDQPDRIAERRFQQLLTARELLTSAERRRAYDELGHEAYRRQSASLGEPVRRADTDGAGEARSEPEPRPGPGERDEGSGQVQRSARGEAHRRGDPVVTAAAEAFGGGSGRERGAAGSERAGESPDHSGGIYRLVTGAGSPESRSLGYVAARWARSWRTRVAVVVGSVLLVAGVLAALPAVLGATGVDLPVPDATAGRLYLVALAVGVAHAGYSCGRAGARLPRGAFLADRDHGRFSAATSRSYRRRGVAALAVALVLAAASARGGVRPWTHTADALRGDLSGPFPWFDAPDADWTTALDVLLSGVFAAAAVSGTVLLGVGASIALWRGRYERGLRVRPTLWEPALVAAPLSAVVALAAGPVALVSLPVLSALPEAVALVAGVDGSTVTPATVAVAGSLSALAAVTLVRVRGALASGSRSSPGVGTSESE
jgi:curved DNA-binding protein CbpA